VYTVEVHGERDDKNAGEKPLALVRMTLQAALTAQQLNQEISRFEA